MFSLLQSDKSNTFIDTSELNKLRGAAPTSGGGAPFVSEIICTPVPPRGALSDISNLTHFTLRFIRFFTTFPLLPPWPPSRYLASPPVPNNNEIQQNLRFLTAPTFPSRKQHDTIFFNTTIEINRGSIAVDRQYIFSRAFRPRGESLNI